MCVTYSVAFMFAHKSPAKYAVSNKQTCTHHAVSCALTQHTPLHH